jgi:hypothetical protein
VIATGESILLRAFQYHETVRKKVVDTILARVVTLDENSAAYVALLLKVVQARDDMIDLTPKVRIG